MPRKIEISHKTIVFTVLFLSSIWLMIQIKVILLQLFVALLLMAIINPIVTKFSKFKIPKIVSIIFSYTIFFGLIGVSIASIIPALIEQSANLINGFPRYLQNLNLEGSISEDVVKQFASELGALPGQIVKIGLSVFSNIFSILAIAIFSFYLLLTRDKFNLNLEFMFGKEKAKVYSEIINKLEYNLGGWARGQLLLMLLVGLLTYVGLLVLGIPYALPLALLAGIFEIIPYLGPILAAVPVVILGFSISPFLGFASVGLAILIQQLENYVFVPKIMEKTTGVSPIITLIALAVGYELAGIVGMIISVPVVIILQTLLTFKFNKN